MAIVPADITWPYSGGAANTSPAACLGGAISTAGGAVIDDNVLHDLFDAITAVEASTGDAEYRCFYVKNTHATLTLQAAYFWILLLTPSGGTEVDIGRDPAGKNGVAAVIADENTAPVGVTFSRVTTVGTALTLGDLLPGEFYPLWVKRTVTAGAVGAGEDYFDMAVEGQTAP